MYLYRESEFLKVDVAIAHNSAKSYKRITQFVHN